MIATLVSANIKHKPIRTLLSILLIAVPVTLILTLQGLSAGYMRDSASRASGVGADIIVRSPDAQLMSMSVASIPDKLIDRLAQLPHVKLSTGVSSHQVMGWTSVSGVQVERFEQMSGGFVFAEGHDFQKPDDIILDTYYAQQIKARAGSRIKLLNREWTVAGIVEPGKLAHIFLPLAVLQDLDGSNGKVAQIYLKVDDVKNTDAVVKEIEALLPGYHIYKLEEMLALTNVNNVPFLKALLRVIIGVGVIIGAAVASLSMYMAIMQRTREIGILKSLGGSKRFIIKLILIEALILGVGGSVLGVIFSFGAKYMLAKLVPASLPLAIVPAWWFIAGAIATGAALFGALYPGILAARQDAIEALSYE